MVKVLSKVGTSLADVYDVEGSIAGIDQLETREVQTVHDMAGTIMSERASGKIVESSSGDIAQNTAYDVVHGNEDWAPTPFRVLGCVVLANVARITLASILLRDPVADREIPIFVWDSAFDTFASVRIVKQAAAPATSAILRPVAGNMMMPSMGFGDSQPVTVPQIVFRGLSSGFGAGTVRIVSLVYIGYASAEGSINVRGLPIPSW